VILKILKNLKTKFYFNLDERKSNIFITIGKGNNIRKTNKALSSRIQRTWININPDILCSGG